MKLSDCTPETVFYVAANMRERDKQEIYGLRPPERANPYALTIDALAYKSFAWVGWHDGKPTAVGGAGEIQPGVFTMFLFATDDFPKIALFATRFVRRQAIPMLFDRKYIAARRLQCDSHEAHTDAHKWLEMLGFEREGVRRQLGNDGADYYHYAICQPRLTDKPDVVI